MVDFDGLTVTVVTPAASALEMYLKDSAEVDDTSRSEALPGLIPHCGPRNRMTIRVATSAVCIESDARLRPRYPEYRSIDEMSRALRAAIESPSDVDAR